MVAKMKINQKGVTNILVAIVIVLASLVVLLLVSRVSGVADNTLPGNDVTSSLIRDGTIQSVDIAENSITSSKILDGSIRENDVGFYFAASNTQDGDALNALQLGGRTADYYQKRLIGSCDDDDEFVSDIIDGRIVCDEIRGSGASIDDEEIETEHIEDRAITTEKLDYDSDSLERVSNKKLEMAGSTLRVDGGIEFDPSSTSKSAIYSLSKSDSAGTEEVNLGDYSFCALGMVEIEGDDKGSCDVYYSGNSWTLSYEKTGSTSVSCRVNCID